MYYETEDVGPYEERRLFDVVHTGLITDGRLLRTLKTPSHGDPIQCGVALKTSSRSTPLVLLEKKDKVWKGVEG